MLAPAPKPTPTDGCCATCIGKSSDMPYTYDPVVHEQCAAAVGLCCYNCGSLEASKPQVENAEFGRDGVTPQVKAGEWIQISWSNVARVTYEYYRVNQNKTTTVRNASYEATQQNKYFTICAKAPGKIYVRGWGTDSCLMATPESYIEILPSTTNSQTCLDKPSFGSNTTPSPAPGDSRGNVVATDGGQARSQQQQIAECNLERASIKTKADGTQECQCTAEWSGPPLCTGFPWWKITLTAGGGLAALLSVIVSVRAFMASRRAKREQADSLEQQLRDSQAAILGPDSIVMMGDPGRGGRDNNNNNNDDVYHQYVSKKPKKELKQRKGAAARPRVTTTIPISTMLKTSVETLGKAFRSFGQSLDRVGVSLEGSLTYTEHLNPSTRAVANAGRKPKFSAGAFVAPNASVIGDVKIGKGSSIWYGATVRGDVNYISIGENTNIQDLAVVHVAKIHKDIPTKIGSNVTVGPSSIIHACTIGDHCIIGTGAQVLDGAEVGEQSIVTAGSIVTYGKKIPAGQLWSGVPARYLRNLTAEEKEFMKQCSLEYAELSQVHASECAKTFEEVEEDKKRFKILRDVGETGLPRPDEEAEPKDTGSRLSDSSNLLNTFIFIFIIIIISRPTHASTMRRQARPRVGAIAAAALSFLAASTPVLAGDCCSCLTQTDPKASVLTYDATVYAQCHAAVGICCFNCGFGHGEPEYVSGIVDGVFPFQAVAGQWLEISINSVARVTYDFLLPNQPKVRFVNNQSTEATATGSNTFKICPKSAGTIIYRGWGAATCTQATDEYNITVVKGSGSATCGAPKPTSPGSGSSHTEQPNNKVDPMGVSSGSGVVKDNDPSDWQHCSSTRGSVQTHKDGSKYCECTGDWNNPPSCNKYSWTRTLLTVGGALATVADLIELLTAACSDVFVY
ncbi:TPA: hypothetical protein N0F65_003318 [Lagenidium giganteum]|uniref:Dynactin subunit 6 n=1 Tax=Lagenidium giganteum TaxID=4803 RepID=A0AAV2Z6U1_9STRA|nr:TPA: hypothetical protein N0F65_003318 [Lagenidium giganteum]